MRRVILIVIAAVLSSCGQADREAGTDDAASAASENSIQIDRYKQPGDGSVNSWILSDGEGIVLIDAQRTLSAGRELAERISTMNKPLVAVLLTHPHPDHFGGLASILDAFPDTPVYASQETIRIMREDANGFIAATAAAMGDDAPDQQPIPDTMIADGEELAFGSIELVASEAGQGEADTATLFYLPAENALFTGDVVDNRRTGFLMEGHSAQWLEQIGAVERDFSNRRPDLYVGHGEMGDMALFEEQAEWIRAVRTLVSDRLGDGVDESEISDIVAEMERRYPDRPAVAAVPQLMRENVKAVAVEMMPDGS